MFSIFLVIVVITATTAAIIITSLLTLVKRSTPPCSKCYGVTSHGRVREAARPCAIVIKECVHVGAWAE